MDVVSVIATIGGCFVGPIKKHCGYLFHYNSNIKDLEIKIQKLRDKRDGLQLKIGAEESNGQVIAPEVRTWIEDVRKILDEDVEANKMNLDGWCPRYSLSKKANNTTLKIDALNDREFIVVSYPPPPLGIGPSSIEGITDFESRTKIRKEVLEALRADKVNMIAICGMAGIGKTTMAKEVEKRVKDEKLFDEVATAVVSQNQDLRKIQVQIAEMLGLKLVEEYPDVRKERLKSRLMGSRSVLVILYDVWDAIDLTAIGIPYGGQHNSCKILLTSRIEEACTQMETQKIFRIKVLQKEEAWNLFREMAGNCIDTPGLHPIAKEVAKECGGLPVAIVTVGRALKNKSESEWKAALQMLKNAMLKKIPGLDPKAYSGIESTYNYLKNEAQSCFLLCCLFPEDYDIRIEVLVRYGMGQNLFTKIFTVAEARNRVHAIVKYLKRTFLLLDSEKGEQFVKMHDVVRDAAISIAENQGFLVQCNEKTGEWPAKDSCERSNTISLVYKELKRHRDGLECPKLKLLQLLCDCDTSQILPPDLFNGMKGLNVLALFGMSFRSLPQSISVLENLRTLQFVNCEITDVSAIGELKKLEILSFLNSKIEKLPGEMRNLSHLKLLELTGCFDLERIPPDLPELSNLEEVYMVGVDVMRKPMEEEEEKKGANTSLTELMSLSDLVALKIQIPNIKVLPKDLPFKNETIKFQIFAGADEKVDEVDYLFKNSLGLRSCDKSDIAESQTLLQLLKKSEILTLKEIKDIKNIAYELDNEGFQYLKVLAVSCSDDVEYVMDATSYPTPCAAFPVLESLELEELINLKEIYYNQFPDRSFSGACFGNLKSLRLRTLPRLIGFCTGIGPVELVQQSLNQEGTLSKPKDPKVSDSDNPSKIWSIFPSHIIESLKNLESIESNNVPSPEVLFQLEELNVEESHMAPVLDQLRKLNLVDLPKLMHIWKKGPERIMGFGNLRLLEVIRCDSLTYLFSPSIAKLLVMLEKIEISFCEKIEKILARAREEEEEKDIRFYKVNSILLSDLPNLKCFCNEAIDLEWPLLKEITVIGCPSLSTFIPSNLNTPTLEGVYDKIYGEERTCHWKGELNATIEHIFKIKEKQANHETQQEEQIEIIEKDM